MITYPIKAFSGNPGAWHLNLLPVGMSPNGFIGKVAHGPGALSSGCFRIPWAAPSTQPESCDLYRKTTNLELMNVTNSWQHLLARALEKFRHMRPVLGVYTETPSHADMISHALDVGVTDIIVDKPTTTCMAEQNKVDHMLRTLAGRCAYVTFNHRYNAPVFQLRQMIRDVGPQAIEEIQVWFRQGWCCDRIPEGGGGRRQQDWRLAHIHGAGLDIGTHIADLASFVVDSPIEQVQSAHCERRGKHGMPCYDTGRGKLLFQNGVQCSLFYSNADPGHLDNIGIAIKLTEGQYAGKKVMWRMETNGGNTLLVGNYEADTENIYNGAWSHVLRRGAEFSAKVNETFGFQPPGHGYDWGDFWTFLYLSIAGDIFRRRNTFPAEAMQMIMNEPPPLFNVAGTQAMRWMQAHDECFVGNSPRLLSAVGNNYWATPPK